MLSLNSLVHFGSGVYSPITLFVQLERQGVEKIGFITSAQGCPPCDNHTTFPERDNPGNVQVFVYGNLQAIGCVLVRRLSDTRDCCVVLLYDQTQTYKNMLYSVDKTTELLPYIERSDFDKFKHYFLINNVFHKIPYKKWTHIGGYCSSGDRYANKYLYNPVKISTTNITGSVVFIKTLDGCRPVGALYGTTAEMTPSLVVTPIRFYFDWMAETKFKWCQLGDTRNIHYSRIESDGPIKGRFSKLMKFLYTEI